MRVIRLMKIPKTVERFTCLHLLSVGDGKLSSMFMRSKFLLDINLSDDIF